MSVQSSKKKMDFWFQNSFFSSWRFRAHMKNRKKVFPGSSGSATWKYLSLSLDLSQTLSQASCLDFFLKLKLMVTCFQELWPTGLRKKIHFFRDGSGLRKKIFGVPQIKFYICRFRAVQNFYANSAVLYCATEGAFCKNCAVCVLYMYEWNHAFHTRPVFW